MSIRWVFVSGAIVNNSLRLLTVFVFLILASSLPGQRPAWTTSHVQGTPTPPLAFRTEPVFGNYRFKKPVTLTNAPGTDSMFLLEQTGKIYELESADVGQPRLVGDLREHVAGFSDAYGLEFHPDFEDNREVFVCYIRNGVDKQIGTALSRMRLTTDGELKIEPDSEEILYTWMKGGHNGGCVKFGPDGYLYISAGDSAAPFPPDPLKAGQDLSNLLSTITRIDVNRRDGDKPYSIPKDNPFVGVDNARPEIFAYGFRNPWRMAFDRVSGDLWVGDVGWELWEMIHCVESGGNYGWSIFEGPQPININDERGPTEIIRAAAAHDHTVARSITGGIVNYGDRFRVVKVYYVYGDHVTGLFWKTRRKPGSKQGSANADQYEPATLIAREPIQIICFGLDNEGELYIVDYQGTVHRLVRQEGEVNAEFPTTLSESGLFSSVAKHELATGVLPYEIIAEPWMDGGTASRFVAIPGRGKIGVYTVRSGHANWDGKHPGSWKFPQNSVLGKTISLNGRRIETQLLHYDGQAWLAYSYLWNDDATDATLAEDRSQTVSVDVDGVKRPWKVSSRGECMVCHSNANDMLLGFKPSQMIRAAHGQEDQLDYFFDLGLLEKAPDRKRKLPASPANQDASLEDRARAYLHVNCAHCHRPQGGGSVPMNVVFHEALDRTRMIDQQPAQGTFGIENARVVAPGDPTKSILLYRFCKFGPGHMPKLGGLELDHEGATLLHDWIASLGDSSDGPSEQKLAKAKQLLGMSNKQPLSEFLSDPENALAVAHGVRTKHFDEGSQNQLMLLAKTLPDASKDLFEGFVPFEDRVKRLGADINAEEILAVHGDAKSGQQLFASSSLSCKNCHAVDPGQPSTGPNLSGLEPVRYTRHRLLMNVLRPSEQIEAKYRTQIVQTADGDVITGVITKETDQFVELADVENKAHRVMKEDIEFRKASEVSLMPERLLETLTMQQARDLIEYLHSLR